VTQWLPAWDPVDGAARASTAFLERFGVEPSGVWSAPGRVNIIGEHTDYNAGLCLPIALPHRTYVALRLRADDVVQLASAQEAGTGVVQVNLADVAPGTARGWVDYAIGVAWALREAGYPVSGFDAVVDSCVPYGAGLSSSAALECAVAIALNDLNGLDLSDDAGRTHLAAACVRAENEIAGARTGGMDQAAALRCRARHALLLDNRDHSARHLPFDLASHDLALLVVDTRAPHQLVDGQYAARRATCEQAARILGIGSLRDVDDLGSALGRLTAAIPGDQADVVRARVRHVVTENERVELVAAGLEAGEVEQLGMVLSAAHASLRDDFQVSCRELDLAVDTAIAAGALGARMVGGGFGGSAIALVRMVDLDAVADAVATAFVVAGLNPPAFLVARPAASAGRAPEGNDQR